MQHRFSASRFDWLENNIALKIQEFRATDEPIIFVEYQYTDSDQIDTTAFVLQEAAKDYVWLRTVLKGYNDGSPEIIECFNEERWDFDLIQMCGVNLDACVLETALGLLDYMPRQEIVVLEDCCNSHTNTSNWREAICSFESEAEEHDNVRLVMGRSSVATHWYVNKDSQPQEKMLLLGDWYDRTRLKVEGVAV